MSSSLVGQGVDIFDVLLIALPFLALYLYFTQGRGEKLPEGETMTDMWYTPQGVGETYEAVLGVIEEWREEEAETEPRSSGRLSGLLRGLARRRSEPRFVEREKDSPRLYRMLDRTGPIYFEFTEVEGGGTVVKATYNSNIKARVTRFKARQPLRIPAVPLGSRCPACGKATLPEFNLCPYCGEALIKE
ncbi:MAG TPA: hypothetical protein VM050_03910 [Patescibacteria group bacterium]|nr:hypothetical protein [Patescibacteria group bacterium]